MLWLWSCCCRSIFARRVLRGVGKTAIGRSNRHRRLQSLETTQGVSSTVLESFLDRYTNLSGTTRITVRIMINIVLLCGLSWIVGNAISLVVPMKTLTTPTNRFLFQAARVAVVLALQHLYRERVLDSSADSIRLSPIHFPALYRPIGFLQIVAVLKVGGSV